MAQEDSESNAKICDNNAENLDLELNNPEVSDSKPSHSLRSQPGMSRDSVSS